jgi:alpha-beta hydrolase superfamily lysophospholipase
MDQWLKRPDAPALRTRLYEPEGAPRGSVLVTTGFSEHVGRYEHVCERWRAAGWLVAAWDLRGQGKSEGPRGYVTRFSEFIDDLFAYLDELQKDSRFRSLGTPIAFAHSMGALLTIHAALRDASRFRALALTSPYLGLALETPAWKLAAGRAISALVPRFSLPTNVSASILTHDAERARMIESDPLGIQRMTARLFTEVESAQAEALRRAGELRLPIAVRAAGDDQLVDVNVTRRFMSQVSSKDVNLFIAEGQFHELHQELGWEQHADAFAEQFARWNDASTPNS